MTAETDLLPLPEGDAIGWTQAWGHDQMRDYARANVEASTEALRAEVERLKAVAHGFVDEIADKDRRAERLAEALRVAEAALADIGDADREPGDDVAWCERRAALGLRVVRDTLRDAALNPTAAQENDDA